MIRFIILVLYALPILGKAQGSFYEFRDLEFGNHIPKGINSGRTAVFVDMSPSQSTFLLEGDWKKLSSEIHTSFRKMGIDAVLYLNVNDFNSGNSTKAFYQQILTQRGIENLVFFKSSPGNFTLTCTTFNGKSSLINNGQKAYQVAHNSINRLLLMFAREVKRADNSILNFLIPDQPTFLDAISIVEKSNLKNYPGQIRRSKLGVEKFSPITIPNDASEDLINKINSYNSEVDSYNAELENIVKDLPYNIELIPYLSDEDLLRRRYQFVLRNVCATGASIKSMLKYNEETSEAGFVSVIPVMPDNTTIKTIPQNALVYKYYIRQNIAKNVYVGEWDADETWQKALENYLGNMAQYFNKGN